MKEQGIFKIIPIIVDVPTNLKTVNFYLIKSHHSLALVDAGLDNDDCWSALMRKLSENNFCLKDITEIVLTHNHGDHVGLVNRITSMHPIPVYAHKDAIPRLKRDNSFFEMRVEFFAKLYKEMGCGYAGDKQVSYLRKALLKGSKNAIHSEIASIGSTHLGFNIIHVPGHALDHIALYDEADHILISGDVLLDHISSNALIEPDIYGQRIPTLIQHKQSMERILALSVDVVYPGHGRLIDEPERLIKAKLASIERRSARLKDFIQDGISTGSGLAERYYKNLYATEFSLVMSEIIGHLDYLENDNQINKEMIEGIWHYRIVK